MAVPIKSTASNTALPKTSSVAAFDRAESGRDLSGNIPATVRKATVQMVANAANQSRETQFGSMALIPSSVRLARRNDSARLFGGRGESRGWPRHVGFRRARSLAHVGLDEAGVVAVQEMTKQAAIEVGGSEQPVHDREGQVHVPLHHDGLVMVGGMVAPDGIDEGGVGD